MEPSDRTLTHLIKGAEVAQRTSVLTDEDSRIRAVYNTSYAIELAPRSSRLHLHYVAVQTVGQGCCYYEPGVEAPGLSDALLGMDAVSGDLGGRAWRIAALDAVYGGLCRSPDDLMRLDGTNVEKAVARASVVRAEAQRVLPTGRSREAVKILVVGVVGDFLAALRELDGVVLSASDYYQHIVGTEVHGVAVQHGSLTPQLVAEADIAIVTGMTLATGTFDEIMDASRSGGTTVIVFAQTGAHFGDAYVQLGVTTVLAEPLPFYLIGSGISAIEIFRGGR
ncbi:MAG TPA: DUF364 domain-containing protein [Solirubrobacteraceae bacterium]|jgi:hypothetical protein